MSGWQVRGISMKNNWGKNTLRNKMKCKPRAKKIESMAKEKEGKKRKGEKKRKNCGWQDEVRRDE